MDLNMNLSGVEASTGAFEPIPPGEYEVKISGTEYKESRSGNGGYLRLQYKVVDGPMSGRSVFENLNLWHRGDQVRMIAQSQLKAIAKAIHHANPNYIRNTDELIGGNMRIKVVVKDDYNNIKAYKESQLVQSTPAAPETPTTPQTLQNAQTPPPPPQVSPAPNGAATPWG